MSRGLAGSSIGRLAHYRAVVPMEAVAPEADRGLRRRGHEISDERSSCTDEYCVASVPVSPRPDFHPDDSDTTEPVETWRAKLFGDEGTLKDKMIGAAA